MPGPAIGAAMHDYEQAFAVATVAARNRTLFRGVVAGVGGYGNCLGVPTVGGEGVRAAGGGEGGFVEGEAGEGGEFGAVGFGVAGGNLGTGGGEVVSYGHTGLLAVGPGRTLEDGTTRAVSVNVGDRVLLGKYTGNEVKLDGVEHIILRECRKAADGVADEACKKMLTRLCDVYALSKLDEHKGWYLEQGYMEGVKTKAIRKMLNQLCWEVRQDAVPLVDSFGIPEACLFAPIAIRT